MVFVAYPCLSIAGIKILQLSKISKRVRKLPVVISNALDLVVGMVTCHRIPSPPAFLVNIEKLGVAWGRGYRRRAKNCTTSNYIYGFTNNINGNVGLQECVVFSPLLC